MEKWRNRERNNENGRHQLLKPDRLGSISEKRIEYKSVFYAKPIDIDIDGNIRVTIELAVSIPNHS